MDYKSSLEKLVEKLRNNPKIDVLEVQINEGITETEMMPIIQKIKNDFGLDFPPQMMDFYKQMNGFKLVWEPKQDVLIEGRKWSVPPCYNEFFSFQNVIHSPDIDFYWETEERGEIKKANLFFTDCEEQGEHGTWILAVEGGFELYYSHWQGEDVDNLNLNFEEFFEAFLQSNGFFDFQKELVPALPVLYPTATIFENWMPVLFEDYSVEEFKKLNKS